MLVTIEKLDHLGRGIAHVNKKIVFIKNALPNEIVDIKITLQYSKYALGEVVAYKHLSSRRKKSVCPYFNECGGCQLLNLTYEDTINFKLNKIKELLVKNKISYYQDIGIVRNDQPLNYRFKLSLKIKDGQIGFYTEKTHHLIAIDKCFIATEVINQVIKNYRLLNLENANLTIRCNLNEEILLIIESEEKPNLDLSSLCQKVKLIGLVYNNETLYGQNFYYERINHHLFKISYDSFFQVNPYVTKQLFNLVEENTLNSNIVFDFYCGVGTLGLIASFNALEVYGVEIIKNAILNALVNAKLNKRKNIKFLLGDVSNTISKLKIKADTIIVDPPRKGLDKNTLKYLLNNDIAQIIYISCDPQTLMRDLKMLSSKYYIRDLKILDMFSYTYHVECLCVLNQR